MSPSAIGTFTECGCRFVGCDIWLEDTTGALHVLWLQLSPPLPLSSALIKLANWSYKTCKAPVKLSSGKWPSKMEMKKFSFQHSYTSWMCYHRWDWLWFGWRRSIRSTGGTFPAAGGNHLESDTERVITSITVITEHHLLLSYTHTHTYIHQYTLKYTNNEKALREMQTLHTQIFVPPQTPIRWSRSTQLLYIEPGYYWDGWLPSGR